MALGAGLSHDFQELVVGSDVSVNGHVLRYVQLLLPHVLIGRPHPSSWSGKRRASQDELLGGFAKAQPEVQF